MPRLSSILSAMEYSFNRYNKYAADGVTVALEKLLPESPFPPVVACIGSDLAVGDSLGPITGALLKYKTQGLGSFVYGTLQSPVTAKEIGVLRRFLKTVHKESNVIAVDAAIGSDGDVGLIKVNSSPLLPGAGAGKKLGSVGNVSVVGVVAEKSLANYGLFNTTRLGLVYTMSEIISDALAAFLWQRCSRRASPSDVIA